jgi:hypothetical protein
MGKKPYIVSNQLSLGVRLTQVAHNARAYVAHVASDKDALRVHLLVD